MTTDTEVKPLTAEMARCYVRCTVPDRGAGEALDAIAEGRHVVADAAKFAQIQGERDAAWAELRSIRKALRANSEESTLDEVLRIAKEPEQLRAVLEWIAGACDVPDHCKCGRPNGIGAIRSHAVRAIDAAQQEGSRDD